MYTYGYRYGECDMVTAWQVRIHSHAWPRKVIQGNLIVQQVAIVEVEPMRQLLIIVVAVLAATVGTIAFIAMFPYFNLVGKLLVGLFAVAIGCGSLLLIAWTHHRLALMALQRHNYLLVSGDVVAVVRNGQIEHLSKAHEEAKRPLMLAPPVTVTEEKDDKLVEDEIRDCYNHGQSEESLAKAFNITRHQVRKVIGKV